MTDEDKPESASESAPPSGAGGSVPESQRGLPSLLAANPETTMATAVYILYFVGLATGIAALIGVVIAHVNRESARGTWLESHYQFQIRTFWLGLAILCVGAVTSVIGIGLLILLFFLVWAAVRTVRGWSWLARQEPVPEPRTLLW